VRKVRRSDGRARTCKSRSTGFRLRVDDLLRVGQSARRPTSIGIGWPLASVEDRGGQVDGPWRRERTSTPTLIVHLEEVIIRKTGSRVAMPPFPHFVLVRVAVG
jgi:hypothetical protein